MGLVDVLRGDSAVVREAESRIAVLSEELRGEQETNLWLMESMADLELMLEDAGWETLIQSVSGELSRKGYIKAAQLCRVSAIANPLIKRGLNVRQAYVFGNGVEIKARNETVDEIVQKFLKDDSNKASLTGSQAQEELERALGTDGNVFLACFTTPKTGRVEVRSIPLGEINDIIVNPEDRDEPWYYERRWVQMEIDSLGRTRSQEKVVYYPDLRYKPAPAKRYKTINGHEVNWNAPIWHLSVNRLDGWKFGIGDAFAAVAWARAYKEFLEDWASLVKALSRFAWRGKSKRSSVAQRMRDKLAKVPSVDPDTGRTLAGGIALMDEESDLEAIPKTGAVIDSESGKPLAAMVAASLELSLVVLLTDPGSTGARAVAETLDEPTIRMAEKRRRLWQEAYEAVINYQIDVAVKAGKLPGSENFDREVRRFRTELRIEGTDEDARLLDVDWPELGEDSVKDKVESITKANETETIPGDIVARLLLQALHVENVDQIVDKLLDSEGRFVHPGVTATQDAVDRFRRGEDPAEAYQ